jgi:cystathionine beta-lyase/cystathionine gamma-synthase
VVEPLVQSVNHLQTLGTADGLKYTRYGNTPNAERLQKRLALIEGAEAALVLSSGMGATACALLALLRPGDHLLSSHVHLRRHAPPPHSRSSRAMGIEVTLVDPFEPRAGARSCARRRGRSSWSRR